MDEEIKNPFEIYAGIEQCPDNYRRLSRVAGNKTHAGFNVFVSQLFRLNEHPDNRWNDKTLLQVLKKEFSHEPRTISSIEAGNTTIAKLRNEYNHAKLQPKGYPPEHPGRVPQISLRYDARKRPVVYQRPTHLADAIYLQRVFLQFHETVHESVDQLIVRALAPKMQLSENA